MISETLWCLSPLIMAKIGVPSFQQQLFDSFWTLLYTADSLSLCLVAFRYLGGHLIPITTDSPKAPLVLKQPIAIASHSFDTISGDTEIESRPWRRYTINPEMMPSND